MDNMYKRVVVPTRTYTSAWDFVCFTTLQVHMYLSNTTVHGAMTSIHNNTEVRSVLHVMSSTGTTSAIYVYTDTIDIGKTIIANIC